LAREPSSLGATETGEAVARAIRVVRAANDFILTLRE
jgi:hypothetical protein